MFCGSEGEKELEINKIIKAKRDAAALCSRIKPILSAFDGRVYSCRLEKKLQETGRIYCKKDNYTISASACFDGKYVSLFCVPLTSALNAEKRIIAANLIESCNDTRERLLKAAYEIETAKGRITQYTAEMNQLKAAIDALRERIPYEIRDIYNLGCYVRS